MLPICTSRLNGQFYIEFHWHALFVACKDRIFQSKALQAINGINFPKDLLKGEELSDDSCAAKKNALLIAPQNENNQHQKLYRHYGS